MPDDAQPADASLDELERRVAAFENATKRLQRNVTPASEVGPEPAPAAAVPSPLGGGSSSSRPAFQAGDDISALRPAVPTPVTGALTARRRASEGAAPSPGFTSAFGKPSIPLLPATAVTQAPTAITSRRGQRARPWWTRKRVAVAAALVALLAALAAVRITFREIPDAAVWAETVACQAPAAGVVAEVKVQVGDAIAAGTALARVGDAVVAAPRDGVVTRLLATPGARLAAGERVAEIALPESLRVVLPVAPGGAAGVGDRVSVRLLGEERVVGGMVERILAPGEAGAWSGGGAAPRRAVIVLDPSPRPPTPGQGARVTLLGRDPGPAVLALFALRRMLP